MSKQFVIAQAIPQTHVVIEAASAANITVSDGEITRELAEIKLTGTKSRRKRISLL